MSYLYRPEFPKLSYGLISIAKPKLSLSVERIFKENSKIICFTTYKSNILPTLYIASEIKKIDPRKIIIFGGPACSIKKIRDFIRKKGVVDQIILGEGDLALLGTLEKISKNKKKLKTRQKDINRELLPDFSGFDLGNYERKSLPYSTTRGCYNNCEFCFDIVLWKKYKFKKAEKIFSDLKKLKELYGPEFFLFADSVILGSSRNIEDFCDLVIKYNFKIGWVGQIKPSVLNKNLLRKMKTAGCMDLSFGIESGSQRILDIMKKNCRVQESIQIMKFANEQGIGVTALFMVGYPTETWKDFFKTLKLLINNKQYITAAFCSPTSIYPGTSLYLNAEKYGIKNRDSSFWYSKNNNIFVRLLRLGIFILTIKIFKK